MHLSLFPSSTLLAFVTLYQFDVACGKHGAASGISSGKGYFACVFSEYEYFVLKALGLVILAENSSDTMLIRIPNSFK